MASTIEWTDETWNPVTGCSRVSPGCDNCYMFALYPRLHAMGVPGYEESPDTVTLLPERLNAPLTWAKPRRVFVNSMSDLFHPKVPFEFISQVFDVMREADQHIFQVLTKRPGRAAGWWEKCGEERFGEWPSNCVDRDIGRERQVRAAPDCAWPDSRLNPFCVRRAALGQAGFETVAG